MTYETALSKIIEKHGNKYDYSLFTKYTNNHTPIPIICHELDSNGNEHDVFYQDFNHHCDRGQGCPKCANNIKLTKDEILVKFKEVHGDKYVYDNSDISSRLKHIKVLCPNHGYFNITPKDHIRGRGCRQCANEKKSVDNLLPKEEVISRIKEIYGDRYEIPSDFKYEGEEKKVKLICKEHGEFYQYPIRIWKGMGCKLCTITSLESEIYTLLKNNDIEFRYQKYFDWLGKMSLDFYLPKYNIAIECQGLQHYKSVEHFGGEDGFKKRVECDLRKKSLCEEHGIKLLYFTSIVITNNTNIENKEGTIFTDKNNLLNEIKTYNNYETKQN